MSDVERENIGGCLSLFGHFSRRETKREKEKFFLPWLAFDSIHFDEDARFFLGEKAQHLESIPNLLLYIINIKAKLN